MELGRGIGKLGVAVETVTIVAVSNHEGDDRCDETEEDDYGRDNDLEEEIVLY
jgi:hypothetical protein